MKEDGEYVISGLCDAGLLSFQKRRRGKCMRCPVLTMECYSGQHKEVIYFHFFFSFSTFFFKLFLKNVVKTASFERRERIIGW